MATIENLPKELLLEIFSHYVRNEGRVEFLRNIPRVCKYWNELSSDSSLWRNISANYCNYLVHLSRRRLLYHTQGLELCPNDNSFSATNLSAVLENIRDLKALDLSRNRESSDVIKIVTKHCPHLKRLCFWNPTNSNVTFYEWDQFLSVCGPTLKYIEWAFWGWQKPEQMVVSIIASKCPLLKRLSLHNTQIPIDELGSGCPRLRELSFDRCHLTTTGRNDSCKCGFKDLNKFKANWCYFSELDVGNLLKDSVNLEHLELHYNGDLVFQNILKIPSNKVRILDIVLKYPHENLKELRDALWKWRHTLSILKLWGWGCDISWALEFLLQDNPSLQLKSMNIRDGINPHFCEKFLRKCQSLIHLKIDYQEYIGREEIEICFGIFHEERA